MQLTSYLRFSIIFSFYVFLYFCHTDNNLTTFHFTFNFACWLDFNWLYTFSTEGLCGVNAYLRGDSNTPLWAPLTCRIFYLKYQIKSRAPMREALLTLVGFESLFWNCPFMCSTELSFYPYCFCSAINLTCIFIFIISVFVCLV